MHLRWHLKQFVLRGRATPGSRSARRALRQVRGLSMLLPGRTQWTGYTSLAVGMAPVGAPDADFQPDTTDSEATWVTCGSSTVGRGAECLLVSSGCQLNKAFSSWHTKN